MAYTNSYTALPLTEEAMMSDITPHHRATSPLVDETPKVTEPRSLTKEISSPNLPQVENHTQQSQEKVIEPESTTFEEASEPTISDLSIPPTNEIHSFDFGFGSFSAPIASTTTENDTTTSTPAEAPIQSEPEVLSEAGATVTTVPKHIQETAELTDSAGRIESTPLPHSSTTLSPTMTPEGCPQLDLSVSTASSVSSISGQSTSSRLSGENGAPSKKRGYMRPQATNFSKSATNRDSVMSLGSIAHLQYYFARTGLLDGKGGQFAKKNTQFKIKTDGLRSTSLNLPSGSGSDELAVSPTASHYALSESGMMESPVDQADDAAWDRELAMLPPTVSTYKQRPAYVQPPPDLTMLRRELTEALEDALKVLKESDKGVVDDETEGWYEIQGLHLLDITTLAIRAAKNYYTAHSQYQRLHAIKSERAIRQELYQVLEILKRMATRNFAGGLRQNEKVGILTWIVGISELIQTEIDQEKKETEERERWSWRNGDWIGREREREYAFIKCFIDEPDSLPEWTPPPHTTDSKELQHPTPFLQYFQTGLQLVHLHNSLVKKSQRSFEIIDKFHTDTNKPYRCAENLRFWVKAAELRWDISLKVDVMGVVQSSSMDAWRQFDEAIMKWCCGVREEFSQEMADARNANGKRTPPRLRVERDESGDVISSPAIPDAQMDSSLMAATQLVDMAPIVTSS
jgi:hypothetical protein